jgi:hypothetical protein
MRRNRRHPGQAGRQTAHARASMCHQLSDPPVPKWEFPVESVTAIHGNALGVNRNPGITVLLPTGACPTTGPTRRSTSTRRWHGKGANISPDR